jgi:hypothetical protein
MKTIKRLELIGESQAQKFYDLLNNLVVKCQEEGLEVEIQYQNAGESFSALIIGRANIIPHDCERSKR